jgi:2-methylisocitrate lyase-like PEP mutase family enzyme
MTTQTEKGQAFRALHQRNRTFIIPNPWDIGTARMLAHLGFEALASTSGGYANSIGQRDGAVGREAMIAHVSALASATDLPVSADLENGYADAPEAVGETIRLAAAAGVVGGSIEDASRRAEAPIYDLGLAAERVRAAAESAHALNFPFTLTARAENFITGRPDLKDTIQRLQAYQEAGADVLYAPGLTSKEDISTLIRSVDRPVNVLVGFAGATLDLAALSALGVRRVSVGSALARAAIGAFLRGAREMQQGGSFAFAEEAASSKEISEMLEPRTGG